MKTLFESNARTNKTVAKLTELAKRETVAHEGNDDPKWAEALIKSLAKKLKKSKYLEEIEKAIINEDRLTDCCTVQREIEDKKKNPAKKNKPHITYLKLWRYPWIKSHHELKAVSNCRYPYSKTADSVCVNPWHYEAVHPTAPPLPPIRVDKSRCYFMPPDLASQINDFQRRQVDELGVPNVSINVDEMRNHFMSEENSPNSMFSASPGASSSRSHQDFGGPHSNGAYSNGASSPLSPQSYLSEDLAFQHEQLMMEVDEDESQNSNRNRVMASANSNGIMAFNHLISPMASLRSPGDNSAAMEMVEYCEPDSWMSITYYEEGIRVGDPFHAVNPYLLIDGFTSPSEVDRFCIGYLNSFNRSFNVMEARRQVGRGARFYYIGGEIYCECLSETSIFVQSPNCNQRHGWHPSTVCKVPPRCNLKVFNNAEFAAQLTDCVEKGFEAVYALTRLCTVRMSFVKGWGADYRRQKVTEVPCWVEAHLNGPLQWIDRVLSSMGAPENKVSSFT